MALKLQIPVIKERIHPPRSKTTYVFDREIDNLIKIPTQVFARTVVSNELIAKDFFYIFSLMESWVYLQTNIKLISNGHMPLIGEEKISLVLTGNAVVDYFEKVQATESFKKTYGEYFKEDELTYRLKLKTSESNRYEIMSAYAIESAVEYLQLVANGLEAIYSQGSDTKFMETIFASNKNTLLQNLDLNVNYDDIFLSELKKNMAKPGFAYVNDILSTRSIREVQAKSESFRNSNSILATNIQYLTSNLSQKPITLMLSPYVYYFSNKVTKIDALSTKTYNDFLSEIKIKLNAILLDLSKKEIYAGNQKVNFKKGVVAQVASLKEQTKKFYVKVGDADSEQPVYSELSLPSDFNFVTVEMPNQYIYIDAETFEKKKVSFGSKPRNHHIIVDQSFAEVTRSGKFQRDSDYVELALSNILNGTQIGSDKTFRGLDMDLKLISVEIPRYSATDYGLIMNSVETTTLIANSKGSSFSDIDKLMGNAVLRTDAKMSLEYLLMKQVFDSDHYFPWINMAGDSKCKSSSMNCTLATPLVQMLFLLAANPDKSQLANLKELLATTEKPFDYKLHLDPEYYDQNPTMSFYDLVTIDPAYLERNNNASLIIKFLTIMDSTGGKLNPELIKKFQTSYNWLPSNINPANIPATYKEFRENLVTVVKNLS
jgi:hypothetical protein